MQIPILETHVLPSCIKNYCYKSHGLINNVWFEPAPLSNPRFLFYSFYNKGNGGSVILWSFMYEEIPLKGRYVYQRV